MNSKEVMMQRVNYKSDFKVLMHLTDAQGEALPLRALDFDIVLTAGAGIATFIATKRGEFLDNCLLEGENDGDVLILADNHKLGLGKLVAEIIIYNPDHQMQDGNLRIVSHQGLEVELVSGNGDEYVVVETDVQLPVIGYSAGDGIVITNGIISVDATIMRKGEIAAYPAVNVYGCYKGDNNTLYLYCKAPAIMGDARLYLFLKDRYLEHKKQWRGDVKRGWRARCAVATEPHLRFVRLGSRISADSKYIAFDGEVYDSIGTMIEQWSNFCHTKFTPKHYRTYHCALAYGVPNPKRGMRIEPLSPMGEFLIYKERGSGIWRIK